jgi:nitrate reductase assembly molybdenum cofactor insertion protein NarJ
MIRVPFSVPKNQRLAVEAAALLREEAACGTLPSAPEESLPAPPLGFGELPAAQLDLTPLLAELPATVEGLREEYNRVFGLVLARECPPYETEYLAVGETFFRSQQLADIAGFYQAFGLAMSHATPERPDHVALELEFMAFLVVEETTGAGG